jgi:hypothetical protein
MVEGKSESKNLERPLTILCVLLGAISVCTVTIIGMQINNDHYAHIGGLTITSENGNTTIVSLGKGFTMNCDSDGIVFISHYDRDMAIKGGDGNWYAIPGTRNLYFPNWDYNISRLEPVNATVYAL